MLALNWALTMRNRYAVILGLHDRDVSLAGVQTQKMDLGSIDHLVNSLEALQPEIVIHTAGLTNVDECESKPDMARHINIELAANVARACTKLRLQLVHISTDHLFSGNGSLLDELHPVSPINTYGQTKAEAEIRILEIHPRAIVIRTNFYGWGPSYRRSFSDVIIDSLCSERELTLFQDVFYTPILIETAVQVVHELINLGSSGIFNVVGDDRISKFDFGLKIAKEFNLDTRLIKPIYMSNQKSLVQRPHDMSLSNKKVCTLLGKQLGGVDEHIALLHQQKQRGLAKEIIKL